MIKLVDDVPEIFKKDNMIRELREKEPYDFYSDYLLGQEVWYFSKQKIDNTSQHYDRFKRHMSKKLGIHFNNISIIGSAKTRFSLSPKKDFSEFRDISEENPSDLDIVLVSQEVFYEIWGSFREISKNKKINNYARKTSEIFRQFISIKDTDEIYDVMYIKEWLRKINSLKADVQTMFNISLNVNYRIYKSWEAVEDYHISGIKKLKDELNSKEG